MMANYGDSKSQLRTPLFQRQKFALSTRHRNLLKKQLVVVKGAQGKLIIVLKRNYDYQICTLLSFAINIGSCSVMWKASYHISQ